MENSDSHFRFEQLVVYQDALKFVDLIYDISSKWPKEELFGLTSQLRRAAVSIVLNLAEGSSRTQKDFGHFIALSRGSCYECVAILTIAKNRQLVDQQTWTQCYQECLSIAKKLSALKRALSK